MSDETKQTRWGHPGFYKTLEKMADLHSRKAHDYAGASGDPLSNFKFVAQSVHVSCPNCEISHELKPSEVALILLATKFYRLVNLLSISEQAKNEPIEDTLMDGAVYSILMKIMRDEETV